LRRPHDSAGSSDTPPRTVDIAPPQQEETR
jgi:hypothetical protein